MQNFDQNLKISRSATLAVRGRKRHSSCTHLRPSPRFLTPICSTLRRHWNFRHQTTAVLTLPCAVYSTPTQRRWYIIRQATTTISSWLWMMTTSSWTPFLLLLLRTCPRSCSWPRSRCSVPRPLDPPCPCLSRSRRRTAPCATRCNPSRPSDDPSRRPSPLSVQPDTHTHTHTHTHTQPTTVYGYCQPVRKNQ